MLLNVIARPGDAFAAMRHLLTDNHEPRERQRRHIRRAIAIYRGAAATAASSSELPEPDAGGPAASGIIVDLQLGLRAQPAAVAVRAGRARAAGPRVARLRRWTCSRSSRRPWTTRARCSSAQQNKARGEAVAAMKAEGIEYEERMELLEDVT